MILSCIGRQILQLCLASLLSSLHVHNFFVRFFSSRGLGASTYCKYWCLAHMTLRNPRKYQQIFAAGIPSAVNTNVNACHPRRASIAGLATLACQCWSGTRQCRPGSVGNAGLAMLAQQCWAGIAGSVMLPRERW